MGCVWKMPCLPVGRRLGAAASWAIIIGLALLGLVIGSVRSLSEAMRRRHERPT